MKGSIAEKHNKMLNCEGDQDYQIGLGTWKTVKIYSLPQRELWKFNLVSS